ncbi:MAG: hypothetical protein AB8C95_01990 [Phycisphaeraceae bacterium]
MRFQWSVIFTCACAAVLGAMSGLVAGGVFLMILITLGAPLSRDATPLLGVLLLGGGPLAGALIGGVYCLRLIRQSPDEWISPNLNKHFCTSCMYDLTHNDSGCCPECGKVIPDKQKSLIAIESDAEHA